MAAFGADLQPRTMCIHHPDRVYDGPKQAQRSNCGMTVTWVAKSSVSLTPHARLIVWGRCWYGTCTVLVRYCADLHGIVPTCTVLFRLAVSCKYADPTHTRVVFLHLSPCITSVNPRVNLLVHLSQNVSIYTPNCDDL